MGALLKDVTPILKLFQNQIKSFHDKNRVWTGVSNFWIIQNNTPVVERIDKINHKKKAFSIRTFDFSTLYTKIPHHLLKGALSEIVDFCLRVEYRKEFMSIKQMHIGENLVRIIKIHLLWK